MKDEGAPPFTFSSGHRIDVGRAIDMHPQAKKLLADETTTPGLRRTMVKTAVIMGFPVEGCVVRLNERSIQAAEYDLGYTSGANTNAMLDRYGISTDGTYKIFVVGHNGDTRGQAFFTSFIGVATSAPGQISPALAARGINTPDT